MISVIQNYGTGPFHKRQADIEEMMYKKKYINASKYVNMEFVPLANQLLSILSYYDKIRNPQFD